MMEHALSSDDQRFREDFEACRIAPGELNHRAHVRLAYVYLVGNGPETAFSLMREALLSFLRHNGIAISKYHETLTRAWILAVRHFMESSPPASSADAFIEANPSLLDSRIMMTHYSAELLFSEEARGRYVEADIDPIPHHE
jgi:hypothetical protein